MPPKKTKAPKRKATGKKSTKTDAQRVKLFFGPTMLHTVFDAGMGKDVRHSRLALNVMDSVLKEIGTEITQHAKAAVQIAKKQTISPSSVLAGTKVYFGESAVGKSAASALTSAVSKYNGSKGKGSVTARAGLNVAPARVRTLMKNVDDGMRVGTSAAVALAAVLDLVAGRIMQGIPDKAKVTTVKSKHVGLSIHNNEDLKSVLKGSLPQDIFVAKVEEKTKKESAAAPKKKKSKGKKKSSKGKKGGKKTKKEAPVKVKEEEGFGGEEFDE